MRRTTPLTAAAILAGAGDDFLNYSITPDEPLPSVIGTATMTRDEGWIKVTAPGRRLRMDGRDGTDVANGGPGRDQCQAEVKRSCER